MPVKTVSIVIPIYNVVSFLEEAITSALSQDYADIEVVVVNDGSTAEASAIIKALCTKDTRIRLVEQPNQGQALARQAGIKAANGEYIVFLDADDVLLPDAVSHLVRTLEKSPSAIASYGERRNVNEQGVFTGVPLRWGVNYGASGDLLPELLQGLSLICNGNICIKREAIGKVEFPASLRQGEDWITWCRLALLGDIVYAGNKPVVHVRTHGQNISKGLTDNPAALFAMFRLMYKDPQFIARIGNKNIDKYRRRHAYYIHRALEDGYASQGRRLKALKHKLIVKYLALRGARRPKHRIRVLHVVKWFYAGGAERLVSSVLQHSDSTQYQHMIVSLSDQNERLQDVQYKFNIPYKSFEMVYGKYNIKNYIKCFLFIRRMKPDVIKTWLPPANIAGGIIGKILGIPVIWGIHNANPAGQHNIRQFKLSRYLPKRIICCSKAAYDVCREVGYDDRLLYTLTNGTDTEAFSFKPEGRKRIRKELGIDDNTLLIGMAAEGTPVKRHEYFLSAAKVFLASHPDTHFLFCGKYLDRENQRINDAIDLYGLRDNIHLLGIRNDMPDIYSALDISNLTSMIESFGLAITEAMSCKTLCIATNVGIIRELLTDVGYIIPVTENPDILANAWMQCLGLSESEKIERLEKGRNRVIEHYSILDVAKKYDALYRSVCKD